MLKIYNIFNVKHVNSNMFAQVGIIISILLNETIYDKVLEKDGGLIKLCAFVFICLGPFMGFILIRFRFSRLLFYWHPYHYPWVLAFFCLKKYKKRKKSKGNEYHYPCGPNFNFCPWIIMWKKKIKRKEYMMKVSI